MNRLNELHLEREQFRKCATQLQNFFGLEIPLEQTCFKDVVIAIVELDEEIRIEEKRFYN